MRKWLFWLLFLVLLASGGFYLYTHWEEAIDKTDAAYNKADEVQRILDSRNYRRLSDQELLKQRLAWQQRVLELYQKKDALHAKGSKDLKFLYQVEELESAILSEKQVLAGLEQEQIIRQYTRGGRIALAVGLPALIFVVLLARILRRRRGARYTIPQMAPAHADWGWLRFWAKPEGESLSPVRIGATQAEILGRLGPPLQRTHFTQTEAWSYRIPVPAADPDGVSRFTHYRSLIVLFRQQKVFDLSWEDPGPDLGSIPMD